MGAIAGEADVLDYVLIRELGISEKDVEDEIASKTQEMRRRESFTAMTFQRPIYPS